MKTGNLYSGF